MTRGQKPLTYYLFDIGGVYIDTFLGYHAIVDKIGGVESAVRNACIRQGCLYGKYYVSHDRNFDVSKLVKKAYFNPILSKSIGMAKFGRETDFIKIYEDVDEFFRSREDFDYLTDNCY